MTAPRVSILIPAYNERHFPEAFASARAQAHPSLEIVVCDDSPGQMIGAIVQAANDPRVRYLRNDVRLGFEANFTESFRQARGTLVKFLNDDDRLRPGCVERLARAFDEFPGICLATSRRAVIDADGSLRADLPATTALAHVTCTIPGRELGDFVLVNGLNLIGEPTTVMFRRADLSPEEGGLFTWNGVSYRCLADLSMWLRLLAQGDAFYCATPLSEYRVHAGQEQRSSRDMDLACIAERLEILHAARSAGFVRLPVQYRTALERIGSLAAAWRDRVAWTSEQAAALDRLRDRVVSELAATAGA